VEKGAKGGGDSWSRKVREIHLRGGARKSGGEGGEMHNSCQYEGAKKVKHLENVGQSSKGN